MKAKEIYVTESGVNLVDKDDGLILIGALFKADFEGGLLGNGDTVRAMTGGKSKIEPLAYTTTEFLDALQIPLPVLEKYIAGRKPVMRTTPNGVQGTIGVRDL